jgi:predicted secreted hydrolase
MLTSCSFPGLASTNEQLPQVSQQPTPTPLPPIHFPQDEGRHNDLTEWWYYTGHLEARTPDGKQHTYGFELVIFHELRSNFPAVYPAHFAISDITQGDFHYDQRIVTRIAGSLPSSTVTGGIDEQVDNWSIQGLNGHDHLKASMTNYAIDLNLDAQKPAVLHNGNGLITLGPEGFSYYYSRTRMAVHGTLLDHQQSLQVSGQAWMDHQWGNFLTLGGGGWDWHSIQLNNNTEMMLYFIRDASGQVLATYADLIDAQGHATILPGSAFHSAVPGTWRSPTTGIIYPSGWHLEINDPHVHADLMIQPLLKDQELVVTGSTGNIYWEGAVSIQGRTNNQPVSGQGYVELTGYPKK